MKKQTQDTYPIRPNSPGSVQSNTPYVLTLTLPSASAVYWAFGDLLINHSNALSLLPRTGFRDTTVILMLIHQFITFGFACTPLYFVWEKFIRMHECKSMCKRALARLPVVIPIWFLAIIFPFFGPINSTVGSLLVSFTVYIIPALAHMITFASPSARENAVERPPSFLGGWDLGLEDGQACSTSFVKLTLLASSLSAISALTSLDNRSPFAPALAEALRDRVFGVNDSERQLHIIYLANDILFDRINPRELDNEALAFKPVLGSMLARIYHNPQNKEENQSRLQKILQFWASKDVYDHITIHALENEMIGGGKTYTMKPLPLKLKLCMREDGKQQVCIVGLQQCKVSDVETIQELIEKGNATRSAGTTGANEESSRSHAILQLAIQRSADGSESKTPRVVGKLSFIDLAGSE
ncbi:unnamed protein product [Camellia sinensis]